MDCEFAIDYEECPCVGLSKEFHMSILCDKCHGSNKLVIIKENYKDLFFVCSYCNGSGHKSSQDKCDRCNGKGYLTWVDQVVA